MNFHKKTFGYLTFGLIASLFFDAFIGKGLGVIIMIYMSMCVLHDTFYDIMEKNKK